MPKSPTSLPDVLTLAPVEAAKPRVGRPRTKLTPLSLDGMTEPERQRYELFINYMHSEYDDLTPFDQLIVEVAAVEYVKYLRWLANEIKTGEAASMARQHPGVQMRENLKLLSVWRKDRANSPKTDDQVDKIVQMFTGTSR
jgi:hypothetical protein